VSALRRADADEFGAILNAGHASVRDQLRISCPALDALTEAALASGALGARLTGAGFGGCAVVFCHAADRERVAAGLVKRYYSKHANFDPAVHLIAAVGTPTIALFSSASSGCFNEPGANANWPRSSRATSPCRWRTTSARA